jgi:uncharacterized protein
MKIGIISDTHINKHPKKILEIIDKHLNGVDMIIHAGDYKTAKVVNLLRQYKNFIGVYGNVDERPVRDILNEKELVEVMGYKIGVYHGHGENKTTLDRAYEKFEADRVDIIIFGHSHQPIIKTLGKVLMLNPGSLTSKRRDRWYSYIILELEKDSINAEIKLFTGV